MISASGATARMLQRSFQIDAAGRYHVDLADDDYARAWKIGGYFKGLSSPSVTESAPRATPRRDRTRLDKQIAHILDDQQPAAFQVEVFQRAPDHFGVEMAHGPGSDLDDWAPLPRSRSASLGVSRSPTITAAGSVGGHFQRVCD